MLQTALGATFRDLAFRMRQSPMKSVRVRRALPLDAAGIVNVLETVSGERIHSAIDQVWTVEQETRYLESQSPREALHVAVDAAASIVGFQSLDLWSPLLSSMAHVGQVGTFLLPGWRGLGVGRQLWSATETFARDAGYRKLAVQVRASNAVAQAFYRRLGFRECGRLTRQVVIDGIEDDEVLMEYFA
jgi:ribosomal protein S18 acetylase RimI-like enzyme